LFYGFFLIEKKLPGTIKAVKFSSLELIIVVLIILSLLSIYDSINRFSQVKYLSIEERRYGYNQRTIFEDRTGALIAYITQYASIFFVIVLFLFNYLFKYYPKKKLLIFLLLLSSTTIIFANLVIAGRDGIIKWFFLLAGNYLLFSRKFTTSEKKSYALIVSVLIIPAIMLFIFTTKGRFGTEESAVINSILQYYGQGFLNFSNFFDTFSKGSFFGRMTFPIFFNQPVHISNLNDTFANINFEMNVFPTIIGSFYLDFGYWGTILITTIIFFFFRLIAFIKVNTLFYTILVLYFFQSIICGVFYYMDYSPPFHKIIAFIFVYIFFLKFPLRKSSFKRITINSKLRTIK
jgi:oligosaccharide repeat unit polymerase